MPFFSRIVEHARMRLRTALFEFQLTEESNRAQNLCMEGVHLTAPVLHSFIAENPAYNIFFFWNSKEVFSLQ